MGMECCGANAHSKRLGHQKQLLWVVFWINALAATIEWLGGLHSSSNLILADAVHLFSHVLVIALSLYAISRGEKWLARAAFVKGLVTASLGVSVLFEAGQSIWGEHALPELHWMTGLGILSFVANTSCLLLLMKHRDDDVNMKSTWICSQSDLMVNIGILVTAGLVAVFRSRWPDVLVGVLLATLILRSSLQVLRHSWRILRGAPIAEFEI
ncbi:MAG: cation transporter [Oligoflexia bacterium]|nr:cation transporter [Oligoflexia bacterium]